MLTVTLAPKDLETLANLYSYAEIMYGLNICDARAAKQKKARKKLFEIFSEELDGLSEEARSYLSCDVSDREIFSRLHAFYDAHQARIEDQKRANEALVAKLTPDWDADAQHEVAELLWMTEWSYDALLKNGALRLPLNCEYVYDSALILYDAQGVPHSEIAGCELCDLSFFKQDERYHICGTLIRDPDEEKELFDLSFTDATYERTVFRADWEDLSDSPWDRLIAQSAEICSKEYLKLPCNEKEKALLPLLRELASLTHDSGVSDDARVLEYPLLLTLLKDYHLDKACDVLKSMQGKEATSHSFLSLSQKLRSVLNQKKGEPLWRELYTQICASQEEYTTTDAFYLSDVPLSAWRHRIEKRMHTYGYSGKYPDFVKEGEIRGLHVRSSYGMSYFVGSTHRAVFHVHCRESASQNTCTFRFLVGTALLKHGEQSPDVTDCLFSANGKRFFATTDCNLFLGDADNGLESEDLDLAVDIAVKKAEMRRMNRTEKKQDASATLGSSILLFLFCVLFMGTFFGFFMTLGFILIEFLTCLFTGTLGEFPDLFMTTPWWLIGLLAGGLFGVAMGIVEVIANRKK